MVYDYIIDNYANGEPIFLSELPGYSKDSLRQEMNKLVDEGRLELLCNGVYYISYITILGTKGRVSIDKFIEKRYLTVDGKASGYVTGLQLANKYGFTTQNPSCYEICSNEAGTKQKKQEINGYTIVVHKPVVDVTEANRFALQFLDLMSVLDRYSEVSGSELFCKLKKYIASVKLDFSVVKEYLPLYSDKTCRNIYAGGLISNSRVFLQLHPDR